MIKFIASDVDGTILQDGRQMPTGEMFELIRTCKARGITFAIASGRQYPNLRRMFQSVADGLVFICENGGLVVRDGEVLYASEIARDIGSRLVREIRDTPGHEVMICGKNSSYIAPKKLSYMQAVAVTVRNTITVFDDPDFIGLCQ